MCFRKSGHVPCFHDRDRRIVPKTGTLTARDVEAGCGRRLASPLPVALALALGNRRAIGLANGRLVPPPSVILDTFAELARIGRTAGHARVDATRGGRAAGFVLASPRNGARRRHRLFDALASAARSDPAGAACRFRRLPGCRCSFSGSASSRTSKIILIAVGRVLSGLSRRHGRGPLGRSQDRRSRPRVPACPASPWCGASCCLR